jgi:GntR family transcriptional regulator, transcriptional repressor for pyruvate dehydrogenase complex
MKRNSKVAETVAREILKGIGTKGLVRGDQLPSEVQMLRDYDVGRGSLREALRILEVHGIIKIKAGPGGGPVIMGVTSSDFARMATLFFEAERMTFRDIVDARLVLEPTMARLAAERRNPRLVKQLLNLGIVTDTDEEYLRSGALFHRMISSMCQNSILNLITHAIDDVFHARVGTVLFPPNRRAAVATAHAAIARCIAAGDGVKAERLMREHMKDYAKYVEKRHPALLDEVVSWL